MKFSDLSMFRTFLIFIQSNLFKVCIFSLLVLLYIIYIYQRVARNAPPININFRLTFLITQLQEALYEDFHIKSINFEVNKHFAGLCFIAEVNF